MSWITRWLVPAMEERLSVCQKEKQILTEKLEAAERTVTYQQDKIEKAEEYFNTFSKLQYYLVMTAADDSYITFLTPAAQFLVGNRHKNFTDKDLKRAIDRAYEDLLITQHKEANALLQPSDKKGKRPAK